MHRMKKLAAVAALSLATGLLAGPLAFAQDTVKVGFIGSLCLRCRPQHPAWRRRSPSTN